MNENKKIRESATKIVFLAMEFAFIWLTFVWKVSPDDFVTANMMVLSFYFWQKTSNLTAKLKEAEELKEKVKNNEKNEKVDMSWIVID